LGENVTTRGIDLLSLPAGARLLIGAAALIEVTGLRNPCVRSTASERSFMKAVLGKDDHGNLVRKSGIMGVVLKAER
jgi:MOSC domain-containing protein YiiM